MLIMLDFDLISGPTQDRAVPHNKDKINATCESSLENREGCA